LALFKLQWAGSNLLVSSFTSEVDSNMMVGNCNPEGSQHFNVEEATAVAYAIYFVH
jgi:hypothetical protein